MKDVNRKPYRSAGRGRPGLVPGQFADSYAAANSYRGERLGGARGDSMAARVRRCVAWALSVTGLSVLTACAGASGSELLEPCDVPAEAEYVMSGYSSECNAVQFPITFTGGEAASTGGRGADNELLNGACTVRVTDTRMSLVVNWDRSWGYGTGHYTEKGCTWAVDLVKK